MISFPKSEWVSNWGIDKSNAKHLYNLIIKNKPQIILETGTFEAQGTYVMAKAANDNNNNCIIYTIDYDGDPTLKLEKEKWLLLKNLRNKNLNKIREEFKNVTVKFVEGDSRNVLKSLFKDNNIEKVDLFYQDSMHFPDGINAEWVLVEPYIKKHSITIFDDLKLKGVQNFKKIFIKKYGNKYNYKDINDGHKQFIAIKN